MSTVKTQKSTGFRQSELVRNHNTKDQSASNLKMMDKSKNRAKNQHSASYKKGK